jgi:hypothetical protein
MSILTALLTVLIVVGVRLTLEQSSYFQKHAKDLPPMPLGL